MTKQGFTLVEVLVAVMLIGIAVAALIGSNISFTQANNFGTELSTSEFLAQQIREFSAMINYSNLHSYDGVSYNPPKGLDGQDLTEFSEYTQQIAVENVSDSDFESVVADHSSNFVRVTVSVLINSQEILSSTWIRARE
ncbi:MAG: prepilin-type N-terminal cleavage/methylation domain-containing protein [Planctomycetota bacterium]|jgi:prepilin-type N-terminal cleavage/methylation domain-containing protein